jgi:hypothetical protein
MSFFLYYNPIKKVKKITVPKTAIPIPEREVRNNISDKETHSSSNANLPKMRPSCMYFSPLPNIFGFLLSVTCGLNRTIELIFYSTTYLSIVPYSPGHTNHRGTLKFEYYKPRPVTPSVT